MYRIENVLKMIKAKDVISEQGGAKCQKLISDQGEKMGSGWGKKFKTCKHAHALLFHR